MNWPESVNEGLPPPRDDEPARLRGDIVDELADHLACAMTHERRRTEDEAAARRNILARFGNPAAVARRLWLDAMKETLMTQRITLVAVVLLTLAGITASAVAWRSMQEGRQVNQAMLAQLEKMSQGHVPSGLSTLSVHLTEETKTGKPVVGKQVKLDGKPFPADQNVRTLRGLTDELGQVTFGPMSPGEYRIHVTGPDGLSASWRTYLYSGRPTEKGIVIPVMSQLPGPEVDVSFKIRQPGDLEIDQMFFLCEFRTEPIVVDNLHWFRDISYNVYLTSEGMVIPAEENFDISTHRIPIVERTNQKWTLKSVATFYSGQHRCTDVHAFFPVMRSIGRRGGYTRSPTKIFNRFSFHFKNDSGPLFEAKVGQPNVWEIEIPEELVEKLRKIIAEADGIEAQN